MTRILNGGTPRCGKTIFQELQKKKIEKILGNMPYHYYTDDHKHDGILKELKSKRLNCRDPAPHEDEIETLAALGLSYPTIRKIIEKKYYPNISKGD